MAKIETCGEGMTSHTISTVHSCAHCGQFLAEVEKTERNWAGLDCVNAECPTVMTLVTAEVFDRDLHALGERMAADGKIVVKQLLFEAESNGRAKCRFENWPEHLKAEAYQRLGLEPVLVYRRTRDALTDEEKAL